MLLKGNAFTHMHRFSSSDPGLKKAHGSGYSAIFVGGWVGVCWWWWWGIAYDLGTCLPDGDRK